jgi:subtilisin family serine protease
MQDTFDLLTKRGRNSRGVLLFFSTGNNEPRVDFTLLRPWAAHARTFAVTASTLVPGGIAETHAKQSNFGGAAVLDFCAPSATELGAEHDPPRAYAMVTAGDRSLTDPDQNMRPKAPSECLCQTTTSSETPSGAQFLEVVSRPGFVSQTFVLIGTPGTWGAEFNQIRKISRGGTRFELETSLKNSHARGTVICTGPAYSVHRFSGTSCATALAAGVGALLLSACPELSWSEARDLLHRTAVKIDAPNADATGIWRDADGVLFGNGGYGGPCYSRTYGFGRIDALAAIEAAIDGWNA